MDAFLLPFFAPQGIVVVGASADPAKLGYAIARNLVRGGYPGAIHFVNPKGGEVFGRPLLHTVADVPDPVDLAVLIVPAPATPSALNEVAGRGIRAAIISSGGFREIGPDGAAIETECLEIARRNGMRLIGPNCIGLIDTHLPLDTSFLTLPPTPKGSLAFLSQSGAVIDLILDWAQGQGFGFSRLVSLGNAADITETDVLPSMVEDENTRVVTCYIESVRDGRRFIEQAALAARRKPVLVLKSGGSASGQRAAASHTGALAGQEAAYEAAFRRTGVQRAATIEELFDWAEALAVCPLPHGRRVAILTNAGGPGVIASDAIENSGLALAEIGDETRSGLAALLPPAASLHNPVDMLGGATHGMYAGSLRLLLDDPGVDAILVILPPPPVDTAEADAEALLPLIQAASKPVLVALMGGPAIEKAAGIFRLGGVPEYRFPERAVSVLAALARRAEFLGKPAAAPRSWPGIDLEAARAAIGSIPPGAFLDPPSAERLMAACGIPTVPVKLARTEAEAGMIAARLGFPVVLKVASPDIPHKSDVGGVLLNIRSVDEAAAGFRLVTGRAHTARPAARLEGVQVQRMLPEGQEVILGASRDPRFGPLMMFGSGGVDVEGLRDVAFALAPLPPSEADDLLARTWAGRKLAGYRNLPPADAGAVTEILQRLACLVSAVPEIGEIEINPLRVMAQGALAVDVRVRIGDGGG
jgi:acetyl coenzyme A synthetase (ADP forming)-like protein